MSADELRKAAETLRACAGSATSGPWIAETFDAYPGTLHYVRAADRSYTSDVSEVISTLGDARYIATMHPLVGLALAESLDDHAQNHDCYECGWEPCAMVSLARLINGDQS